MLSDKTIMQMLEAGDINISPRPNDSQRQPVSIDLLLGNSFCVVDRGDDGEPSWLRTNRYTLQPGCFVLATTLEFLSLPDNLAGVVHGKSTYARQGLVVESAGLVDPGFNGCLTLELFNMSALPLALSAGQTICQIAFHVLDTAVLRPYGSVGLGSHYQGQTRAEPAR